MDNFIKKIFPPERISIRLEKNLQRAISANDQPKAKSAFCKLFMHLSKEDDPQSLSHLFVMYGPKIENIRTVENEVSHLYLKQAVNFLEESELTSVALTICNYFGYDVEAIKILAKHAQADDLSMYFQKDDSIDKQLLRTAIVFWEKCNGDVGKSPSMSNILINIAKFSPESIPDNPRAKEVVGQFKEAAVLYIAEKDLYSAARCYELSDMYIEAFNIYEHLGDKERASKAAESMGNLEKALELVVNPERKAKLLIYMERFAEAQEFAVGLESPEEYFDLIKVQAKQRMEVRVKIHDFVGALELADVAECESTEREEILLLGRKYFDRQLASAKSEGDIKTIYRKRVELEERAGYFEDAGRIAEEVLNDLDLASLLYEKANLFHRAIGTASGINRLAHLHEKGGNLFEAAKLYESAGLFDKASALYERMQKFNKAIECYLKTSSPSEHVLVELYTRASEFEKIIEIYMNSGEFSDLEKALSLATTHHLASHIRVIKERMAEFVLGDEKELEKHFAIAREEVVHTYSTIIGIDFGTTNSVVAIFNRNSCKVEIIPGSGGTVYEPTFFGIDENNHPVFGEMARLRSLTVPDCVVARVKRSLGEKVSYSISGKSYRNEEVVAYFLQHLRSNAKAYVQSKVEARFYDLVKKSNLIFPEEVSRAFLNRQSVDICIEDVVLSVPAYFNDNQKRATRDAAEIAGLRVRRLLNEPSAAALAYNYQKQYSGKLAVVDLGGGTLDISIVDIAGGIDEVLAIGGDPKLGGSDIDALLVQCVIDDIRERWGIELDEKTRSAEVARIRSTCEDLKINLSSVTQDTVELRYFLNKPTYTFSLTRTELERLSKPILSRIETTIEKTLKEYGKDINNFLLAGNATKMPIIGDLTRRIIPAKQLMGIDPGTVVATGAALVGATLAGDSKQLLLLDIVPYSLGIAAVKETDEEVISRLIEKNSTIPIRKSEIFTTKEDNQPNVHIKIYQGESLQPHQNYFLGDFLLEGIPPAPAHSPQIEVSFEIDADCILTVTARDKKTGNQRSIRVERAIVLSPQEKRELSEYFSQREKINTYEKELAETRLAIDVLKPSCEKAINAAERSIEEFFERFHEKVEVNPWLYKVQSDQIIAIQEMITEKEQFVQGIQKYRDQFASTFNNLTKIEARHLDFSDKNIVSLLKDRIEVLSHYKETLVNLDKSIEMNVTSILVNWIQTLDSMEPDLESMKPLEVANYHLIAGRASIAKEILESLALGAEGLTNEAFHLLLKSQALLGLRDEYRDTHRRYGQLFDVIYPDFNRLNAYLKAIDDSVFMIQGYSPQHGACYGSGFCIAPNLIVTNRHVVEGMNQKSVEIIGKNVAYVVDKVDMDAIHDIAILTTSGNLKPLRLGEFGFVEPGEQVLAIGFPSPSTKMHSENIYISKGTVNSIRNTEISPERVIFIDTKIGSGMSGGPLINDLGEVIGIVTLIRYGMQPGEKGMYVVEDQPVALPINLIWKYL